MVATKVSTWYRKIKLAISNKKERMKLVTKNAR